MRTWSGDRSTFSRVLRVCSNLTYEFGISEKAKERMDRFGRVHLTDVQADQLSKSRATSICFVTIGIGALSRIFHCLSNQLKRAAVAIRPKLSHRDWDKDRPPFWWNIDGKYRSLHVQRIRNTGHARYQRQRKDEVVGSSWICSISWNVCVRVYDLGCVARTFMK